jgi:hypothetical protein
MVASKASAGDWVFLVYRLPREPSTPRSSVWRKLRRIGAVQLADGLVALPDDARTREQLEWIAEEVLAADGSAMLWQATPTTLADERQVATAMAQERAIEYSDLIVRAEAALDAPMPEQRRALRGLRGELRQIRRRDYFAAEGRDEAVAAVDALAATVADPVTAQTGVEGVSR